MNIQTMNIQTMNIPQLHDDMAQEHGDVQDDSWGGRTVWTGDCSATVDLARCAGPSSGATRPPACLSSGSGGAGPEVLDLSVPAVKVRLYECCLRHGTAFDIYRWINIRDLAALWPLLDLPAGVHAEWGGVLHRIGLLDAA